MPPRDSIEWQQLTKRRIGYISAASALTVVATWLIWIARQPSQAGVDWMSVLVPMSLIWLATYGLFFLGLDAAYGQLSGATKRARKYMDQVYPPEKRRNP